MPKKVLQFSSTSFYHCVCFVVTRICLYLQIGAVML
jgi:hypothetical protein